MLVLSRKVGESIVIADGITLTVLKVKGQRVSLGIEAPTWVSIQREELTLEAGFDGEVVNQGKPLGPKQRGPSVRKSR